MKLEQIDQRLTLFSEYLKISLSPILLNVDIPLFFNNDTDQILKTFREVGFLMVDDCGPQDSMITVYDFDEWLFQTQRYDLVDYAVFPKEEGLIDHVKKRGRTLQFKPPVGKFDYPALDNQIEWRHPDRQAYDGYKMRAESPINFFGESY